MDGSLWPPRFEEWRAYEERPCFIGSSPTGVVVAVVMTGAVNLALLVLLVGLAIFGVDFQVSDAFAIG